MTEDHFELRGEYIELHQLLKLLGWCSSGGGGKRLVAEGLVSVDDVVELRKSAKIRAGQRVQFGAEQVLVDGQRGA